MQCTNQLTYRLVTKRIRNFNLLNCSVSWNNIACVSNFKENVTFFLVEASSLLNDQNFPIKWCTCWSMYILCRDIFSSWVFQINDISSSCQGRMDDPQPARPWVVHECIFYVSTKLNGRLYIWSFLICRTLSIK